MVLHLLLHVARFSDKKYGIRIPVSKIFKLHLTCMVLLVNL